MPSLLDALKTTVTSVPRAAQPRPSGVGQRDGVVDADAHRRQVEQFIRSRQSRWRLVC